MKILIAEDDSASRLLLKRSLENWGHEVAAAADGAEAWELFQSGAFAMVISDWMMPGMDGPDLVRRIRGCERPGYVYIVLLTARSGKEDIVAGMDAGADDFLTKPFDHGELRVRIRAGNRILRLERNLSQRNEELQQANRRMARDLRAAAKLQQALLPTSSPDAPGVDFAWIFMPTLELAGDTFNVFRLDEHHAAFYLLDVSGHGVPAALLSVTLSRFLSPTADHLTILNRPEGVVRPAEVARRLNGQFYMDEAAPQYFTLVYAVLDYRTRELRYVCAGHPGPALLHDAETTVLESTGPPVGWFKEARFDEAAIELKPGDRFYVYSDGITEAANGAGEHFGLHRLTTVLEENRDAPLRGGLATLLQNVVEWRHAACLEDDVSCVALDVAK